MKHPIEESESIGAQSPTLNQAQCDYVLKIAQASAHRNGFQHEDREDRIMGFLLHLLLLVRSRPEIDVSLVLSPAWLTRAADNWIKNAVRAERRRQRWELDLSSAGADDQNCLCRELRSTEPLPDTEALRAEFCRRLHCALQNAHLTSAQYALLDQLLLDDRPVDIARRLNLSSEIVRQRIRTLRVRLRHVLNTCNLGEAEIREYLSSIELSSPPL